MRTISADELTLLAGPSFWVWVQLLVQDVEGTWQDLTNLHGYSWLRGYDIDFDIDQPVAQATFTLRRDIDGPDGPLSLSPLRTDSVVNRKADGTTFASLVDVARRFQFNISITAAGAESAGAWHPLFAGVSDRVNFDSQDATVLVRDLGGAMVDAWSLVAGVYNDGLGMEVVLQRLLDDYMPTAVTLVTPESPLFEVTNFGRNVEPVMDTAQRLVGTIGWDLRYLWTENDQAFELTLSDPDRAKTTPDATIASSQYINITELAVDRTGVRNHVEVEYGPVGGRTRVIRDDLPSQKLYGYRPIVFQESDTSPIDTDAEAGAMADAALHDLKDPKADHSVEMLAFWPAELRDLIRFTGNGVHYTADQDMAAVRIRHTGRVSDNGTAQHRTVLDTRGTPAGMYRGWLKRAKQPPPDTAPTDGLSGVGTADHLATRDINWVAGADVMAVLLYIVTLPASSGVDVFTAEYLATLTPIVLARDVTTYSVVKAPSGSEVCVRLEARSANGTLTDFRNLAIPAAPFDWAVSVTGQTSFQVVVVDPAGVVHKTLRVKAYVTVYGGVRTLTDPTTAPAAGVTGGTYGFTVTKSGEKHSTIVEPVIFPADGSDPLLTGALPFDPDNIANVKTATIVSIGSDAVLSAAFDTDAVVGAHGAEYSTDAGATWTNLAVDASYHASTTIARDPSVVTNVLLHGINSVGAAGPDVPLQVQPYLVDGPTIVATPTETATQVSITWDGVGIILLSIDGGAPSTPSASPIVVAKSSTPHSYVFTAAQAGQTVQATVDVPILDGTYGVTFRDLLGTADVGAGTLTVTWTATDFATGVTFDLVWSVDGGASGEVLSADPTGEVITTPLSGTPSGTLRVTAFDGDGLQLAIIRRTGVFAT